MDIGDLSFFLAVARAGGISRASKELLTVQSNISSRIRALEDELGVELFRRHARGVTLTNPGERLLPYAEHITRLVREVTQVVGDDRDPSGRLAIGSMETTAGLRLPGVLAAFSEECPRVDFILTTDTTDALTARVLEHRLDGAFVCGPVRHPDLVSQQVFIEQLVLVSGVRIVDLDSARADGRRHKVLVLRAGCAYRARLERLFEQHELPAPDVLEFGTLEGVLGCVAAGMGVTLLPLGVVTASPLASSLKVHHLAPADSRAETLFVRRKDSTMTPALSRFLFHTHESRRPASLKSVAR
ncbi:MULTISPECIES: LysR substrate-binding domain-containing protein [unclassified Rhodococcus (in: high G+C Gram-positive bacteria)]|uniref:LysR substrate-binding domain-containing protein n=1 Tax=unclassified Rhodococcus (in: high G+C Gram-positive bacteria) TaxID=192944 RepID=UPI001639D670|nr:MULTISPECIES: LysR substrate-binding domain-containing protein [unclassified Rhodococcus (in: high G+C Gram-positive bacteria)]MBC2638283.1 LysR family transcriptional regulator [Rhodococcus sp. 3A]MBC2896976.1 LysR family transcriptional regulator [Rhodococcus sp. 4CII]